MIKTSFRYNHIRFMIHKVSRQTPMSSIIKTRASELSATNKHWAVVDVQRHIVELSSLCKAIVSPTTLQSKAIAFTFQQTLFSTKIEAFQNDHFNVSKINNKSLLHYNQKSYQIDQLLCSSYLSFAHYGSQQIQQIRE